MIHLPHKDRDNPPALLSVIGALRQINRAIQGADGKQYTNYYYRDSEVVALLQAYSIHKTSLEAGDLPKCNYCESRITKGAALQVEHYRPKAKVVSGENDHVELPGYYWLGLEWTNLLLACPKCNGKNAKSDNFPIRGTRAQLTAVVAEVNGQLTLDRTGCYAHEGPLSLESPILLNPEIDHPEEYLTFDRRGTIEAHGADADRGRVTAEMYRLNRQSLFIERQKVWNEFSNDILLVVAGHQRGDLDDGAIRFFFRMMSHKILKRRLPSEEFTLWGRYINDHLAEFLTEIIDVNYVQLFINVYDLVLQGQ